VEQIDVPHPPLPTGISDQVGTSIDRRQPHYARRVTDSCGTVL
jgi:hypothetical protein